MRCTVFLLCVVLMVISGCTGGPEDARLVDVAEKVSDSPEEMLARLDSIDVGSLKESDRYLYALLRIKAQDKAYVKHTSDSVILKVIDYYSGHKGSGHYPEALYYGGRVYSDIGDAPTSLRYFQEALDALPENEDNGFRATILVQAGWLLNSLRLYSEAAGYIKEAIQLQSENTDTVKIMQDIQLLGAIYMHGEDYDMADSCFHRARNLARHISSNDTVKQNMYLAGIELFRGNINRALSVIRGVIEDKSPNNPDMIYAYASQIYLEAGIVDTAYLYAAELIKSENNDYRKNGYSLILSPELRRFSTTDSLLSYSISYSKVIDEYLSRHDAQQVGLQTSLYNYESHERLRRRAENSRRNYMYIAGGAVIIILLLGIILMYLRNKSMHILLQYQKALDDIALLREALSGSGSIEATDPKSQNKLSKKSLTDKNYIGQREERGSNTAETFEEDLSHEEKEKNAVRDRLKEQLLSLQKAGIAKKGVPEAIASSSLYGQLQEYINDEKLINDASEIWNDIEKAVLAMSPDFKSRLYLLAGDRLKKDAYHMALLIRCGLTPTELSILVGRSKGAVSSRRGYICEMIFGQKLGAKVMDDIIRLL